MEALSKTLYNAAAPLALAAPDAGAQRRSRRAGLRRTMVVALLAGSLAACASHRPEEQVSPPPGMGTTSSSASPTFEGQPPSGLVEMEEVQVAYIGNAGGGEGTLTFQGQRYPFKIAGLGVGGIGISTVDAEGVVYRLSDLAQFPGAYVAGQYGAVAGTESVGDIWLENSNTQVVMHLKAKREGLMLSVGADAIDILMSE